MFVPAPKNPIEWPTVGLFAACYGAWGIALWLWPVSPLIALGLAALAITLQASLQHEAIHGHPTQNEWINASLSWPPLVLAIPFLRFRDTHLAHHRDAHLTDPYDDPESNFLDAGVWERMPLPFRVLLRANNTLLGRLILGPILGQIAFMATDARDMARGDRRVVLGWILHLPALVPVLLIVAVSPMPIWAYLVAVYAALGILKIRTFLEHQAHERASARSVVIEDRGPLAFLFLNNNFHVVHHMKPRLPWYAIPAEYRANRDRYLTRNGGYKYYSYGEVFRRYLVAAKDPVAHPLWRRD